MEQKQLEENYKAAIALLNIREEQIGEFLTEGDAEQSMHLTAFGVGMLAFFFGFGFGWFVSSRKFGGN